MSAIDIAIDDVLLRLESARKTPKKSTLILKRQASHGKYRAIPAHRKAAVQSAHRYPQLLNNVKNVLRAHALHTAKIGRRVANNAKVPHNWLAASEEMPKEFAHAAIELPKEHKEILGTALHLLRHAGHFAHHPIQAWQQLSPEHKHSLRTAAWMGAGLGGIGGFGGYFGLGHEAGEQIGHLWDAYNSGALHPALVGGAAAAIGKLAALHFAKDAAAVGAWHALKNNLYGHSKHAIEKAANIQLDPKELGKWLLGTFISYWAQKIADALAVHMVSPDDLVDALYEITQEEKRRGKPYTAEEEKQLLRQILINKPETSYNIDIRQVLSRLRK